MTNDEFKAWRKYMGFSQPAAGRALGISVETVKAYERGTWANGTPAVPSDTVSILCGYIRKAEEQSRETAKRAKGK